MEKSTKNIYGLAGPRAFGTALALTLGLAWAGAYLDACNSSTAPVVEADPNAEIVILAPTGGERITIGDTLRIKWKIQGKGIDEVNAVNIELSPDSGRTWVELLTKSIGIDDPLWRNYPWPVLNQVVRLGVPFNLANNDKVLLKIMQYSTSDTNKIATTKKPFSIVP